MQLLLKFLPMILASVFAALAAWNVNTLRWEAKYAELEKTHAEQWGDINQRSVDQLVAVKEQSRIMREVVGKLDIYNLEAIENARKNDQKLLDAIGSGNQRLSVLIRTTGNESNNRMPGSADNTNMVDGQTRAELDPTFAQSVFAVARDGDDAIRQLTALQDHNRKLEELLAKCGQTGFD